MPENGLAVGAARLTDPRPVFQTRVWVDQEVEGLTPGYAYSVWWAIFDNPQGCDGGCDASDLSPRQVQPSLVNGGGFVAEGSSISYSSHLARHDVEGRQVQLAAPDAPGQGS